MRNDLLWRDTGLAPKFFIVDARAIFPIALWLFHWTWWTAIIAISCVFALYLVQRTGMTPMAFLRALRVTFIGKRRETGFNETVWRKRCRW